MIAQRLSAPPSVFFGQCCNGACCVPASNGARLLGPVQRIGMDNDVSELLVHSILVGSGNGLQLARLVNHPALFPFSIHLTAQDLATSRTFRLQRQGDQSEHVELV